MLKVSKILKVGRVVFHGTIHDFDEFIVGIKQGAGAMRHGWGVYVTQDSHLAKNYAQKAYRNEQGKRILYEVEIPDEPYLHENLKLSKQPLILQDLKDIAAEVGIELNLGWYGETFYYAVADALKSEEAASKLLRSYEIYGIEYIQTHQDDTMFCVFDGRDLKIQKKVDVVPKELVNT